MSDTVRVRFAPSPTGHLHLGGARTALFNWLFARHHGGSFILRIEDTDASRSTKEYIESILEALRWLGLTWDEGPYFQTERQAIYRRHAEDLLERGRAYRCYCTPEELDAMRKEAMASGRKPRYDGRCRERKDQPRGKPHVVRVRVPDLGTTVVNDMLRGRVEFANQELDDFIILRSDGTPTYNFVVVVDDHAMDISHVIRGDDHLANTPKQVVLYQSMGIEPPRFAHLPSILGPDRARLSKRHGATSVLEYRRTGFLPDAMVNYLARLGWSYGDQEIFTREELVERFSLDSVNLSGAVYDQDKLLWVNGQFIRGASPESLKGDIIPFLREAGLMDDDLPPSADGIEDERLLKVIASLQPRSRTLVEMARGARYFFDVEIEHDEKAARKFLTPETLPLLEEVAGRIGGLHKLDESAVEKIFSDIVEREGIKLLNLAQPVRVALTGGTVSPGIYEVIRLMGKELVLKRLRGAAERIKSSKP